MNEDRLKKSLGDLGLEGPRHGSNILADKLVGKFRRAGVVQELHLREEGGVIGQVGREWI